MISEQVNKKINKIIDIAKSNRRTCLTCGKNFNKGASHLNIQKYGFRFSLSIKICKECLGLIMEKITE